MSLPSDDLIQVTLNFKGFGAGKTQNQSLSLLRPFRLLLEEGKPIGRINYLFYISSRFLVLGTLCFTPWHRLLFFPGLVARTPRWYGKAGAMKSAQDQGTVLDHLTLESDRKSFHATVLSTDSRRSVLTSRGTKQVVDGLTYWFGLSVQSEKVLEECPEEVEFHFSSPPRDSQRKIKVVIESRDGAKFHKIEQNPGSEFGPGRYLHFDFLVDIRGSILRWLGKWRLMKAVVSAPTAAPTGPPALKCAVSIPPEVPVRCHPVGIPSFNGIIWVVTSIKSGELVEQAIVGSL